jgi:hypothetical protein
MAQRDKQQRLTRLERVADIAKEEEPKYALPAAWEFGYDLVNDPEAYARAARELCPSLTDAEISAILAQALRDVEQQRRAAEGASTSPREQEPLDLDEDLGY